MKRISVIVVLCLFALLPAAAADVSSFKSPQPQTQSMTIGGRIADQLSIGVDVISSSNLDAPDGTPFNIEGDDVLMSSTNNPYSMGRLIAYWFLYANRPKAKITVTAEPLKHTSIEADPVHYILRFSGRYQDGFTANNNPAYEDATFYVASKDYGGENMDGIDDFYKEELKVVASDTPIILESKSNEDIELVNSEIRVFIPYDQASYVQGDAPAGAYTASVTLTVEVEE